jgi:hypothetical protein
MIKQFPDLVSSHSRWSHHGQGKSRHPETKLRSPLVRQRRNWRAMVPRHTLLEADPPILTSMHVLVPHQIGLLDNACYFSSVGICRQVRDPSSR